VVYQGGWGCRGCDFPWPQFECDQSCRLRSPLCTRVVEVGVTVTSQGMCTRAQPRTHAQLLVVHLWWPLPKGGGCKQTPWAGGIPGVGLGVPSQGMCTRAQPCTHALLLLQVHPWWCLR